jgi:hypothetical protein
MIICHIYINNLQQFVIRINDNEKVEKLTFLYWDCFKYSNIKFTVVYVWFVFY